MRNMTSESTSSSLSSLPIHKLNYAGKKRGPIKSPRRSSTSSNLEPPIEVNREMRRHFSNRLTNNEDVNFPKSTKLLRSMDNEKENKLLKSYNRKKDLQKWSQGNIKLNQVSVARNKLLHQSRPLLPVEMKKKFQSVSDIKSLNASEIPRVKPLRSKSKPRLVKNTSLTDTKDKSKTHSFRDAFKTKALVKQPASRDMKTKSKYTILPQGKSTNMSRYCNDHSIKCEFCKARSCEQQNKPHHAAVKRSMINIRSVSQYQVKQKYRRSSLHLKPFSLFFRKKSSVNGSNLQVDLTSAVKCIKERSIALEKYLPNSEDLNSFSQNNLVGHIPIKNSSSLAMFFFKSNRKKYPSLRKCETGLCGAKGCNQLMCCSRNRCQFKTENREKKSVCSTFNIKHIESKSKLEQDHSKKRHRLKFSTEKQNRKSESTQFSKSALFMCDSKCITCKCKSISLRKTHVGKNIKSGPKKSFEHALDDSEIGYDNEAVCLRHYVNKSHTKNSSINITSSFDYLINLSDTKQSINTSKRPEHKNKPIIRPDTVSYNKKVPTLNRILQASSISYLRGVYSKLFPITNTKEKDKSTLKEKTASQKIQFNRCNQNLDSPPRRKQIPGDKSKTIKVQNVEYESVFKRYFGFMFNKIIKKDDSADANIPKTYKKTEFKNHCKNFCKEDPIMKKFSLLESGNLQQSKNADIHLRKNAICRSGIMTKQDIMYSRRISCENIGYCPLSIYTEQPVERITRLNKYEPLNGQKPRGRISSNFSLNIKFYKDSRISFHSHETKQKKDNSDVVNTQRPRKKIYNQEVQKTFMVNPTVMSLLQTKYINNKPETYKYLPHRVDKTLNNISCPGGTAMEVQSQNNQTIVEYDKSQLLNLGKSELLNPNDDCRKHSKKNFSTSNTSIKVSLNKISRLKLNTACKGKNWMFIPLRDSQYKPRTKNLKKISLTKTGTMENSLNVFRLKDRKNEVTSAYCHITYDLAGNPTCERDTTCAPQCTWIHKNGKSVAAGSHVIESFCPFEDRNFMIQPCVTQTQEDNKFVKERPREIENSYSLERDNFKIQPCVIQTQEDTKLNKKINNTTNIISYFFNKTPAKKKCDCVCSSGDAPIKNTSTNYKPKLTIEVDTDKMNIKNREEVLKRAIKLKELEGSELGEGYALRGNKSSCCCTGFKSKNPRCISCKNFPNGPNLKLENVRNKELLEIEMDSDSNILNRADVLKRIKKMKQTGNEYFQSEIKYSGNEHLQRKKKHTGNEYLQSKRKYSGNEHLQRENYSDTIVDFAKIKNKLNNFLAKRPTCVCDNEVCFQESESKYLKQEIANKKEKPCVCGAPSCERFSIERLVKEGKLSHEDGRYLIDLIKKQEVIQKKERIRKQKAKRKKEKERLKEKHLQQIGKAKKISKKKSKEKTAEHSKEQIKSEKIKKKEKKKKELQKKKNEKLSKAQRETEKIKIEIQRQKREEEERKEMEAMEEHKQAITLEQTFKRQMLVDDRKENKQLRKSQFEERIKRAKEKRYQRMRAKKRKKHNKLLKEKEKLQNQIEQAELKKHKEKQQIKLAEKLRKHKEKMKKKNKKEKKKREKKKLKIIKAKMKKRILKEKKRRANMLKKKKLREKKKRMAKIRKENKRFLKEMRKLAAIEREERMKEAEKKQKLKLKRHEFMREEMKKYKDVDDRYLVLESLKEIGACCVKYTGKLFNYLSYTVRHPDLTKKKMHRAYLQPGQVVSELRQDWSESEVHNIANRIEAKILAIDRLQPIGKKLYSKPKKKRLPKHQFKKRKRNRRAPMDFGCSLYMASLRNKPYFILYWMCPWFYPHLISILKVLRQLADAGLFVLAAFVWSPLILLWELFRTIMCCGLCTA